MRVALLVKIESNALCEAEEVRLEGLLNPARILTGFRLVKYWKLKKKFKIYVTTFGRPNATWTVILRNFKTNKTVILTLTIVNSIIA